MRTRLSTKGQVILPKAIRDKHRWKPGTALDIEDRPDGVLLKPVEAKKKLTIDDWAGIVKYKGPPKSIEEMNAAIDEEFKARHARGRY
ncbi:MAG TPA: AbrB/MazE/SpoVT family DNA-binding domain-containing protein [Reyranella sp.]|nr:AbrB/MazE/SpoVT family DNA-binding domain-containing protein [Reyranella sp.]